MKPASAERIMGSILSLASFPLQLFLSSDCQCYRELQVSSLVALH
jgi:hypothetical protein